MSSASPPAMLTFVRDVTVTFTIAGVTLAARVSIARSSESSAPTLSLSSGVVVGLAMAAAALAGVAFMTSYVTSEPTIAIAITGTIRWWLSLPFKFAIQLFISFFSSFLVVQVHVTNYLVDDDKKTYMDFTT